MKKQKTHEILLAFLEKQYMKKEGAVTIDIAIRDCLTDLFHIAAETSGTDMHQRLLDAEEVWNEEATAELLDNKPIPKKIKKGKSTWVF